MIEKELKRIADYLEEILGTLRVISLATPLEPKEKKVHPGANKKGGGRVTKKAQGAKTSKEDFLEDAAKADAKAAIAEPIYTLEQVRDYVRQYAGRFGGEAAIEKIIKYGADKHKPLIADVNKAKYAELIDELMADIQREG